uniref:Myosin motor domain-containing protein n=1 Tax=Syphacia muris TaxID=451379 RepID=A0A0N5AW20_9BILA
MVPKFVLPLELTRLVWQQNGERNFDVFYQMCSGIQQELRHKFGLNKSQKYFYLNLRKRNSNSDTDEEKFGILLKSFKTLEMSEDQQTFIFRILSAILHFGNLFFTNRQVSALTFIKLINFRDSIAQIVYNSLVRWIISLLANDYGCSNYNGVISLVDYYGFERYNNNGYEQLCVNIVNEYIENFFYKKVFKEVEKEYEDELITIDYQVTLFILPLNVYKLVDLLLKRPDGLISLLNDECKFPKASNEGYLKKCDLNHSENSVYGKSRSKDRLEFGVKHFCGFNYYNANGFVQKNCQHISAEAIKMLANSQNAVRYHLFITALNTIFLFKVQTCNCFTLLLIVTNCQFVRCIRSNTERQPEKFCDQTIIRQIRAYALLDTAKITRRGYTTKSKIIAFAERYSCILPKEANDHESINEKVHDILEQQGFRYQNHYAIGKTNVYLKDDLYRHLEQLRNNIRGKSAITIQKSVRGMLARNRYEKQRHAAVVIQSGFRAWKARSEVKNMRDELIKKIGLETKKLNHISNIDDDDSSTYTDTDAVVQYLDLPEDLQKQIKISRNPKSYKTRTVVRYNPMSSRCQIPKIPNLISIEEFAETCFKGHLLGARREPIATPFLPKDFDNDFKESLLIFRLILRYMNDTQLSDEKLAVLAKYILQKGIDMPEQRDEIYVQLCNQTYNNRAVTSTTRAWTLLLAACNCFAPSIHVFPMLMSYFQTIPEHLSNMLISGLLRRIRSANSATQRLLPSTFIDDEDWLIDGAGNQFLYDLIAQRELLENCTKAELPTEICKACFAIFNNQTLANVSKFKDLLF